MDSDDDIACNYDFPIMEFGCQRVYLGNLVRLRFSFSKEPNPTAGIMILPLHLRIHSVIMKIEVISPFCIVANRRVFRKWIIFSTKTEFVGVPPLAVRTS